jgi:hypothetical protein
MVESLRASHGAAKPQNCARCAVARGCAPHALATSVIGITRKTNRISPAHLLIAIARVRRDALWVNRCASWRSALDWTPTPIRKVS